ncbi:MAG: hypothetical protein ACRDID_12420, partial [Ktedonobacterales bacterium]
ATLSSQSGDTKTNESYVYLVTRQKTGGKPITYKVTITLALANNTWGLTDVGASIFPTEAGVKPVSTPTPTPTPSPSASASTGQ